MFFKRTEEEIVNDVLEELTTSTNITQLAPGAVARTLLEIVSREQGRQHDTFDTNMLQTFIRFCDDKFLDIFGDMLNLPRVPSQKSLDATDNFMFYVSTGTFGDINGSSDIVIPAGTIVSTVPYEGEIITPGLEQQPIIEYYVVEETTCQAGSAFQYAPIVAQFEGTDSNIPRNVLNQHNYTGYSLAGDNLLLCTNKFSIANGTDRESDQAYRFRLGNIFKARQVGHEASIRLAALAVPGVNFLKYVNNEQGPGTYSLYVQSQAPTTSSNLLDQVAASTKTVTAGGNKGYILAPEPLGVEFVATVTFVSRATQQNISEAYVDIRNAVEEYISDLNIGDSLRMRDVIDVMASASQYISSVGSDKPNAFDQVYLYRINSFSTTANRSLFIGNEITPLYNERIILETSSRHRGIKFIVRS